MTDDEKNFIIELRELTLKYKVKIAGCGCCGSPYLCHLKPEENTNDSGYAASEDGDYLLWIVPGTDHEWKDKQLHIVKK